MYSVNCDRTCTTLVSLGALIETWCQLEVHILKGNDMYEASEPFISSGWPSMCTSISILCCYMELMKGGEELALTTAVEYVSLDFGWVMYLPCVHWYMSRYMATRMSTSKRLRFKRGTVVLPGVQYYMHYMWLCTYCKHPWCQLGFPLQLGWHRGPGQ